jgi:hypothetical protein
MADLVGMQDARDHLRVDNEADNTWLMVWIPAISQAVQTWLKDEWRPYVLATDASGNVLLDSSGDPIVELDGEGQPIVKPLVSAAVLVEIAQQYRFRDGSGAAAVPSHAGHGYVLGAGATSLLNALRKSTLQ